MKTTVLYLFFICCCGSITGLNIRKDVLERALANSQLPKDDFPYVKMTTTEIIESFGYTTETHHVETEDGYILELHRIPYGVDGPSDKKRPIAFLQHCLLCSSSDFVMDKPDRALAYLLADAGYDVWMNNFRGNTYSRKHKTLDPDKDKRQFWAFTWDEMAVYDIPAAVDYVLEVTGDSQVYYIGFSMGTTSFFAFMSEKPQYAEKIKVAALMGPVAYVEHIKGPMRLLANTSDKIDFVLGMLGHYEFLASGNRMDFVAENLCAEEDKTSPICSNILFLFSGYDKAELNEANLPNILSHMPAGTSFHTINHYGQLMDKGVFQKYDWGKRGNEQHYGQKTPPVYNLGVNTPPIALFWGPNDWLADPTDVARLASELKNLVLNYRVASDKWNHLDFVWAIHAKEYVYDPLLEFLSKY